tara:strand:+ start:1620 stop:1973 length:354 start_codon:yes stop_codon:yes gene_type:complete
MASTRDINSKGNYCLEQKALERIRENLTFYNSPNGHAYNPSFPELYTTGRVGSDVLSCNNVDIESSLFGINSSNLVESKPKTVAQLKTLSMVSFFDKPEIIKSKNVYQDNNQRPFIV